MTFFAYMKYLTVLFHNYYMNGAYKPIRYLNTRVYTCTMSAEYQTRMYVEMVEMLKWFAGNQIRNVAVS